MNIILKNKFLYFKNYKLKCSIGKNGISNKKKEGDGKTPLGTFEIENLYYRVDKIKKPLTKLKCIEIKKNMGWCDDVNSKLYNKPIKTNTQFRHEKLYRNDRKYDLLIPIKYNFIKPKINKGSAIFLHLTNNYKKTKGCIAIKEKDMLILLRLINKKTKIKIN